VFQARWRNLDVAVKTVLFSQQDSARQEKAIVEAALATSVIHLNVVSVYHYDIKPVTSSTTHGALSALHIEEGDLGPKDFKMYLVQELCQTSLAESLNKWVFHDQQTGLPRMDLVLSTLTDVCSGCAYIHSKNILWGDLKPENVLLKMDHTRPHGIIAKITDFGMSTTIDPTKSHVSNYNKGTVGYSAPEVIGAHHATKTSDVYSFGVLMQQMVTRSTPWAFSPTGALEANRNFWRMVPNVSRRYVEIQRRCLHLNQKLRPSFDEVKAELLEAYDSYMVALNTEAMRLPGQDPAAAPPPYPGDVPGY
jgi:serine/threonine protein kinase